MASSPLAAHLFEIAVADPSGGLFGTLSGLLLLRHSDPAGGDRNSEISRQSLGSGGALG
jgi:hypothetical protein